MALLVWLPLMGNLENKGLKNVGTSTLGTITYENGKLGQAARIGSGTQVQNGISIDSNLLEDLGSEYSCSVWVKPTGAHVHYEGAILSSGNWNKKKWAFGIGQNNTTIDPFGPSYNIKVPCTVPVDEWTHIASTVKDNIATIYKNGVQVGTYNFGNLVLESDATNTTIGRETYASGYFSFNGCIQDIRIYDHALSPLEVKEISKALVLHLPLDREGLGSPNLIINSKNIKKSHLESGNEYIALNVGQSYMDIESGTQVTLSFDLELKYVNSGTSSAHRITIYNTNNKGPKQLSNVNWEFRDHGYNVGDTIKTRVSVTTTIVDRANATSDNNYIEFYSTYNTGNVFSVSNLKLELGDKATPWCPNEADDLYTAYHCDDVIHDISGYNYPVIGTNITYDSDTPRYQACAVLDGTSYIKIDTNEWMVHGAKALTWSIWAYSDDWSTETDGGRLISCTESGGFNIEGGASGYLRVPFYVFKDSEGSSKGYVYYNSSIQLASLTPGWHLFTTTYSTSEINTYVDGTLTYSYSYTSYGIGFNKNARLFLGCEANTANPGGSKFVGKLSDFRLYYSTLSAENVYNLYTVGASLSDTGVLFSNEVSEV